MQNRTAEPWRDSLNTDLKNVPLPCLPSNAGTMSEGQLVGPYFLQVEEIVNVLASSLKQFAESGRRMLKLKLTDGAQYVSAVEQEKINCISVSTPPGTKILITGPLKLSCGFWLIESRHIRLLGGTIPHMLRAWEINRDIVIQGKRLHRADDRPPWVPFGEALKFDQNTLKFRAMDIINRQAEADEEDDEEEENERTKEFALHREQVLQAARGDNASEKLSITKIGPLSRRPPQLLQITQPFMSAEEPSEPKKVPEKLPRDARDLIDKSDPGVEPVTRGFRGRGRGGRRGGRRGRGGRGRDDFDDFGSAPPQRSVNLMDFVTHQLGGLSAR